MDVGVPSTPGQLALPVGASPAARKPAGLVLVIAFVLAGAILYFAAAKLGLALRLPGQPAAAIWAPNALLLAALMLLPRRWWWIAFAASVPAHLAANIGAGFPLWRLAWQIAFNWTLTASTVFALRQLVPGRLPFRKLRDLVIYLAVAVLAIPAVLAWIAPNALLQLLGQGSAATAWIPWRSSFFSNAAAFLVLVPAIVLLVSEGATWIQRATVARCIEGIALSSTIWLVSTLAFDRSASSPALLYAPLPLLLWAAVRFGVAGIASALSGVALIAAFGAIDARGPFTGLPAVENLFNLQMFLFAIALPLLILAVLMDERARAAEAIRARDKALHASLAQVRDLAGRLIGAQDAERSRIAQDIHDDHGQQLAAVAIGLSRVAQIMHAKAPEMTAEFDRLQDGIHGLAESLRKLSHELHPGVLRHVGLVQALQTHCEEFAERNSLEADFQARGETGRLPPGLDAALFRVAQEALRNVARHAHATHVGVTLVFTADSLELVIADDGRGFMREASEKRGLGLLSLEERVRAVGGSLEVASEPGRGTEVRVKVPLHGESGAAREA